MVIRHAVSHAAAGLFALTLGVAAGSSGAFAQANVLKECGSQYQAAKAANELNGQTWQDYLKGCKERIKAAAPAEAAPAEAAKPAEPAKPAEAAAPASAAPAPAAEAPAPNPLKPPATTAAPSETPAAAPAMSAKERQKKCAAEWKEQKAELKKSDPKITWPKYWSACNKRLKGE